MFAIVDAKGMTLYAFDKNSAGKSVCNGSCAQNWPPTGPTPTTTCADVGLVDVPASPDPAFTPSPEVINQRWGELRLPVADRFVTEFDPPDQEHLGQIAQAELVAEASEYHERDDIGRIPGPVENSAAAFIELLATGTAAEPPVAPSRTLRPFRNLRRVARHAPHGPD